MRLYKKLITPAIGSWNKNCGSSSSTSRLTSYSTQVLKTIEFITPQSCEISQIRTKIAPWVKIGSYEPGLLSHLSTLDITRALFVLRMCSYDFIVGRSTQLFDIATKFGPLTEWPLRKTFFNQFVGGDSEAQMAKVVGSMQRRGLVLMVAPVLEEDVEDVKASQKTYDDNLQNLIKLAEMTSSFEKKKPIIQLKPTAIMPAVTLENVSKSILNATGKSSSSSASVAKNASLVTEIANCIERPGSLQSLQLSDEDRNQFLEGLNRADAFVKQAQRLNVHVLVDAEFYSCKPAISTIALALMARYNSDYHIVGNTIQAYLKDAVSTVESELQVITQAIGVNWYGKIVRGAYMDRERDLAKKNSYNSPICDTYDLTNASYNRAVDIVLRNIFNNSKRNCHLLVATHNEVSIRLAAQCMKDMTIDPSDDRVSFGQIYGMADYLSTPLVNLGYHVYKSTPYGPIAKVLPYLARRASENRSVMMGAREERDMLWKELKTRMKKNY